MCGVVGIVSTQPVNEALYNALTVMQHRGQDAAGIVTWGEKEGLKQRRSNGLVRDVFRHRHMLRLDGRGVPDLNAGIATDHFGIGGMHIGQRLAHTVHVNHGAKADFVDRDGIIFVDDWNRAEANQSSDRRARIEVTRPVG